MGLNTGILTRHGMGLMLPQAALVHQRRAEHVAVVAAIREQGCSVQ
jgi:hypothetical protein